MEIAVVWHVTPCSPVDRYLSFRGMRDLHLQRMYPEDGGSIFFRNVNSDVPD
jgi:hypothetical protein